jgi:hypothetical protein
MEPNWVRPAYLRLMCLVGIVIMAYGLLGFVLGIVHVASPSMQRQSDPIFRIASAVVDVARVAYAEEPDQNPTVIKALDKSRSELDRQARAAGLNELVRGLVLSLIGAGILVFHWRRAERPSVMVPAGMVPAPGPPAPGWASPQAPPAQQPPPGF